MPDQSAELIFLVVGILLTLTVLAGSLSTRFGLPAILGFLALGMVAGSDGPGGLAFEDYAIAQGVGVACLAFILFSGGLDTEWRRVRAVALPAVVLATIGVALSAAIVAGAAVLLLDFAPYQGFLLGAVVASTDAAAVFAMLRSHSIPLEGRVQGLIELESGTNDPTAVFLVGATILLLTVPGTSLTGFAPDFAVQMLVGGAVGGVVGFAFPMLLRRGPLQVGGLALVVSIAVSLLAFGLAGASAATASSPPMSPGSSPGAAAFRASAPSRSSRTASPGSRRSSCSSRSACLSSPLSSPRWLCRASL